MVYGITIREDWQSFEKKPEMVLTFIMSERQLPDVKPNEQLNIAI
jgi:hypothetical protein